MKKLLILFVLSLLIIAGCGGDDNEPTAKEKFMQAVEGRYAHYDIVAYTADVEGMGEFKNLIISYGITEFTVVGDKLMNRDRFCHAEQISNQPFVAEVPDSLTRAIIPDDVEMEIHQTEDGEYYLYRPQTPTLLGIEYDDPYNTPLPTEIEEDDPRLVDMDNDGKPGVTTYMDSNGTTDEIYIARREIFEFEAYLQDNGDIEGHVNDFSEQLIIGGTNPLLTAVDMEWVQHEDRSLSPIFLTPIDADMDCDAMMAKRDELLPPNPEVWED